LRQINPRLIYAVVNGFGPHGPDRTKGMVDGAGQARGGLINMTGKAGGAPIMPGAAIADMAGAMQFVLGIMTALVARERFGVGQKVQTSSYGAQLWLQTWEITQSSITGHALTRQGAHHPNVPGTYGVYETKDGHAIFHAFARTEEAWHAFCAFAGHPDVAEDDRWNSVQKRMGMGSDAEGVTARQVRPFMEEAFKSKTLAEWTAFLDSQPEIIYNKVATYDEVLADPQAAANDYFVEMDVPHAGRKKLIGNLVHLSETPGAPKPGIPELGQHTEEILLDLGYDWPEIVEINAHTREALRAKFIALGAEPPH
jgi:crotonobetainyl-CoA:carnitine CoA-transferase CaiB-like acyl-CoA transferase